MGCTLSLFSFYEEIFTVLSRNDLVDVNIEETVSHMQTVIELGRYIRDKKVVPVKVIAIELYSKWENVHRVEIYLFSLGKLHHHAKELGKPRTCHINEIWYI